MAPVFQLLIMYAVLAVIAFSVRRITLHIAERKLRLPILQTLDFLIGQAESPDGDPPSCAAETTIVPDLIGERVVTRYFVYPAKRHYFSFSRVVKGRRTEYRLGRWNRDVLPSDEFPPWPGSPCRSAWFVERMEKLCGLIDARIIEAARNPCGQR